MANQEDIRDILNRRVAIDVMGEPEPQEKWHVRGDGTILNVDYGSWMLACIGMPDEEGHFAEFEWEPLNFSGDMNLAMKAAAKVLERLPNSKLEMWVDDSGYWNARIPGCVGAPGRSKSPAEAICHMLTFPITLDRAGMGP